MKKIVFVLVFVCLGVIGYSQNNLQFNQVLTYTGTLTTPVSVFLNTYDSTAAFTVPTGKVWKIESLSNGGTVTNPNPQNIYLYFQLNNTPIFRVFPGTVNATTLTPIWLKAGDYVKFKGENQTQNSNPVYFNYYMSIIEYNIVP